MGGCDEGGWCGRVWCGCVWEGVVWEEVKGNVSIPINSFP